MKWTNAQNLKLDIAEEFDTDVSSLDNFLDGAIFDALMTLGLRSAYNLKTATQDIESDGTIMVPTEASELWEVMLETKEGNLVEPAMSRNQSNSIAGYGSVTIAYNPATSVSDAHPVLAYDPAANALFFRNSYSNRYEKAHMSYLAVMTDDCDNLLVPTQAAAAVRAYMSFRMKQRLRNRDQQRMPQSEVQAAQQYWVDMAGHARGRISKTSRPRMREMVRESWYRQIFPGPETWKR